MLIGVLFLEVAVLGVSYFLWVVLYATWVRLHPWNWGFYRPVMVEVREDWPVLLSGKFWYWVVVLTLNLFVFMLWW